MNYDDVAEEYDRRYALHRYRGIRDALFDVVDRMARARTRVLELGCGTGKWLSELACAGLDVAGVDPSPEMLRRARASATGDLRLGHAEQLPWPDETFDLVVCINALHHFRSPAEAIAEAHRVLRRGGAFLSIGLDPHAAPGAWYVYDFFPTTLAYDLERFPAEGQRLRWLQRAGFERITVKVAERIDSTSTFEEAMAQGILAQSFTSQLTVLADSQYLEGVQRIRAAAEHDESFRLRVHLELYSTEAWKPV